MALATPASLSRLRPTSQSFLRLHSSLSGVKTDDCSPSFVHPAAIVHPSANLGEGVSVGPFCTVGPSVKLGNSCKLYPGSHVFGNSELGDKCTLMTGAVVGDELPGHTLIGSNNIIAHWASCCCRLELSASLKWVTTMK